MFDTLTLHGGAGSLLWGYRTAAVCKAWRIAKHAGQWRLTATLVRGEPFMLRQTPLLFTAPHEGGRDGFWAWGIEAIDVAGLQVRARLGPPEQ